VVVSVILLKEAEAGVVAPIITLSILPVVAGLTTNVPVPVGLIVMLAFAGLSVTAPVVANVLKTPVDGTVAPIDILSKVLALVGLIFKLDVTVKFATEKLLLLRLNVSVLVEVFVAMVRPP
jgi:hypothetical protein